MAESLATFQSAFHHERINEWFNELSFPAPSSGHVNATTSPNASASAGRLVSNPFDFFDLSILRTKSTEITESPSSVSSSGPNNNHVLDIQTLSPTEFPETSVGPSSFTQQPHLADLLSIPSPEAGWMLPQSKQSSFSLEPTLPPGDSATVTVTRSPQAPPALTIEVNKRIPPVRSTEISVVSSQLSVENSGASPKPPTPIPVFVPVYFPVPCFSPAQSPFQAPMPPMPNLPMPPINLPSVPPMISVSPIPLSVSQQFEGNAQASPQAGGGAMTQPCQCNQSHWKLLRIKKGLKHFFCRRCTKKWKTSEDCGVTLHIPKAATTKNQAAKAIPVA